MTNPPQAQKKPRPGSVTFAVWLQLLLAAALAVSAVVGYIYGTDAQDAFEAELGNQGVQVSDLPDNSANFEGATNLVISLVIVVLLVLLAMLNGAGKRVGRILTWIFQPLVLLCGGALIATQMFLGQWLQWAFDNSGDAAIEDLDGEALADAVFDAFPAWSSIVDWAVFALATLGSLLVIILLAVPSANAYFRKEEPQQHIPGAPPQ